MIEVTGRRGRRRKKLLDDLKESTDLTVMELALEWAVELSYDTVRSE